MSVKLLDTLEESLQKVGLLAEGVATTKNDQKVDDEPNDSSDFLDEDDELDDDLEDELDEDTDPAEGTPEFEALPIEEQLRIKRKRKRRRRRPKVRRTASEKAKQRIAARKRRRTAGGKKRAKLRAKAMKLARKRGMKPGEISIRTASAEGDPNAQSIQDSNIHESRVSDLLESLESLVATTSLSEEGNELRSAYEEVIEIADLIKSRFEGLKDDLSATMRKEADQIIEAVEELKDLSENALMMVLEGKQGFKNEEDLDISLDDVLEDIVAELEDYVKAIGAYEQEV